MSKLKHAMNIIFKILRTLTIILYLALNIVLIYMVFSQIKYPAITNKYVAQGIAIISAFTILIPGVLIAILFIKKDNVVLKVCKILIQLLLLIALRYIFVIGLIMTMAIPSHTTNPANYENLDESASNLIEKQRLTILPDTLPDNITDIDYLYDYNSIFNEDDLTFNISYTYNDDLDYQNAKAEMQAYEPVTHKEKVDGFNMIYTSGESSNDNKYVCFGYNDDSKRVTYRIRWKYEVKK